MKKKGFIYVGIMLFLIIASFAWINREKEIAKKQVYHDGKSSPIHLNKAQFISRVTDFEAHPTEWKYLGDKPCIIDFYASWCGPCKLLAPILDDLAKEYDGRIYIYKVNIDAEQEIAGTYGIQSIPTLFFCPMNGAPQIMQGALPKDSLKEVIIGVLLKKKV